MRICFLFQFTIKEVSLEDLEEIDGTNIKDKICAYYPHESGGNDTNIFYIRSQNALTELENDYNDDSFVTIVNMDDFEHSNLRLDVSTLSDHFISEKEETIRTLKLFHDLVFKDEHFECKIACQSSNNKSLVDHLNSRFKTMDTKKNDTTINFLSSDANLVRRADKVKDLANAILDNLRYRFHKSIELFKYFDSMDDPGEITRQINNDESVTLTSADLNKIIGNIHGLKYGRVQAQGSNKVFKRLGSGGYGATYEFNNDHAHGGTRYVLKVCTNRDDNMSPKPSWYRESYYTKDLKHENIIKYYGKHIFFNYHCFCIMEHGGETVNHIYHKKRQMPEKDIKLAMLHIAKAINYLHRNLCDSILVHRDVRCNNITVDKDVYKLIDFGISSSYSKDLNSNDLDSEAKGEIFWFPPIMNGNEDARKGRKVDIYSFGTMILEMLAFPNYPECVYTHSKAMEEAKSKPESDITKIAVTCLQYYDNVDIINSKKLLEMCEQLAD